MEQDRVELGTVDERQVLDTGLIPGDFIGVTVASPAMRLAAGRHG